MRNRRVDEGIYWSSICTGRHLNSHQQYHWQKRLTVVTMYQSTQADLGPISSLGHTSNTTYHMQLAMLHALVMAYTHVQMNRLIQLAMDVTQIRKPTQLRFSRSITQIFSQYLCCSSTSNKTYQLFIFNNPHYLSHYHSFYSSFCNSLF